jgi:ubiquinone/menaquinone biosynthesis C-methylase UbiE
MMFPSYLKPVSRFFRQRRNRPLVALINDLHAAAGRPIEILDIGGSIIFWLYIPQDVVEKCNISLVNQPGSYDNLPEAEERIKHKFTLLTGDARDLKEFEDKQFDLVVCNSVIEHVGSWLDMENAANEALRLGQRGWVQVPAFEFPVEQHFLMPFIHWFANPVQVAVLGRLHSRIKRLGFHDRQMAVHHVRPLTREELTRLFPEAQIRSERLVIAKSHLATW